MLAHGWRNLWRFRLGRFFFCGQTWGRENQKRGPRQKNRHEQKAGQAIKHDAEAHLCTKRVKQMECLNRRDGSL